MGTNHKRANREADRLIAELRDSLATLETALTDLLEESMDQEDRIMTLEAEKDDLTDLVADLKARVSESEK
jgi:flagellar motility protein MotE (MotC chaperone)